MGNGWNSFLIEHWLKYFVEDFVPCIEADAGLLRDAKVWLKNMVKSMKIGI